jgi:alkyl hydroperoxide reductase subunit AhpC
VLLVFYPFAFSAVCGAELAELSARADELTAVGVRPLAVSTDAKYALRAYADSAGIALPLLSDFWPHGATASAYRVFDGTRGCALRGSFLIDPSGLVRWRLVHGIGEARPWSAYADALAVLDS